MRYGIVVPQFEAFGEVRVLAEMAREAEAAGWDGFFIWDSIVFDGVGRPMADPWVALTAIALATERVRIGTLVTPVARRRPWKLARETVSIDRLSGGRLILGVGLGDPKEWEFAAVGEDPDPRTRAEKLDEGLDVLAGLWSARRFSYSGKHFQIREVTFAPGPVQRPRIPIWVGGWWPAKRPMRRAARWDGVCPGQLGGSLTPDDWREILGYIRSARTEPGPFDAVHFGVTPGDRPKESAERAERYSEAGVTWWVEAASPYDYGFAESDDWTPEIVEVLRERVRQGPPRR